MSVYPAAPERELHRAVSEVGREAAVEWDDSCGFGLRKPGLLTGVTSHGTGSSASCNLPGRMAVGNKRDQMN